MTPDVVVIGAGVAGLSAAVRLAELGCRRVTVLERRSVASGSSGLSAGIFNRAGFDLAHTEVRVASCAMIDRLERDHGLHASRIGYLRLASDEATLERFRASIALVGEVSERAPDVRLLAPDEIAEVAPDLRVDDLAGALWSPRDGHTDGSLVCSVLAEVAQAGGVDLRPNTELVAAEPHGDEGHLLRTTRGDVRCDRVVNAAGPWAGHVGDLLGAPMPIDNQLHEVIKVSVPRGARPVPVVQGYVPGGDGGIYFRAEHDGMLLAGLHTYTSDPDLRVDDPDRFRRGIEMDSVARVGEGVEGRLAVDGLGFAAGWTGLYPTSPDEEPFVGPYAEAPGVIAVGGLGGFGITYGLSLGRAAAEWAVLGEAPSLPHVARFLPADRVGLPRAS